MKGARVFISCGQRDEDERRLARSVADWLAEQGFRPYVALDAQSILDVNSGIIGELRRSDYYVFIDFRREDLPDSCASRHYRGSLFSHQELALAYAFGFEHAIFFREEGVRLEGLAAFMAANATVFEDRSDLPKLVEDAIRYREWDPRYSRNLVIGRLSWESKLIRTKDLAGRFLFIDIENRRPDVGAFGTIARLTDLELEGQDKEPHPNRSPLKVSGQDRAYQQTIWPQSHGAFDLLCVDAEHGSRVYLNNALDLPNTPSLFERPGQHLLYFEVFAQGFDVVRFCVRLRTTANCREAEAELAAPGGATVSTPEL